MNIPLSIEQASNWIKERTYKFLRKQVHEDKQIKDFQPSIAPEADQQKYLLYCISLLESVSPGIMSQLPSQLRIASTLSSKQVAMLMRRFMIDKIYKGYSYKEMAVIYQVPEPVVEKFDFLCQLAVKEAINKTKREKVPILGG
jgi:hypothetical protein